jgi:CRISPR-associated endonuclease/helicase Cas3
LFALFASGQFPENVNLPTGIGKTSIMALWLLAFSEEAHKDVKAITIPQRLIWVVNRRVVVDQATSEVERLRRRLNDTSIAELEAVRAALRRFAATDSDELLGISTLRGQFADNAEWRNDPARPAVIVGTVDMVGSLKLKHLPVSDHRRVNFRDHMIAASLKGKCGCGVRRFFSNFRDHMIAASLKRDTV